MQLPTILDIWLLLSPTSLAMSSCFHPPLAKHRETLASNFALTQSLDIRSPPGNLGYVVCNRGHALACNRSLNFGYTITC